MRLLIRPFFSYIASGIVLAAFVFSICEVLSYVAYLINEGKSFSYFYCNEKRNIILGLEDQNLNAQPQELHATVQPYFGYVYDPKEWKKVKHNGLPVSSWGFVDDKPSPLLSRDNHKYIVGVLGGSVALWASTPRYSQIISEKLKSLPSIADKEVVVVRLALGGMKQPQQLMLATYLFSLGAHFDLLINLDGVNEMVEPHFNRAQGINPFYPVNWKSIVGDVSNSEMLIRIALLHELTTKRAYLAKAFQVRPLNYSITANYVWILLDRLLDRKLSQQRNALSENIVSKQPAAENPFAVRGQPISFSNDDDFIKQLAYNWAESSYLISQLSIARGIPYFHFLQPNQYDTGSKKSFTNEEITKGVLSDPSSARFITAGYPLLRNKGKDLLERGVNFIDLSNIFVKEESSVYQDSCCHLNQHGNEILVNGIVEAIVLKLSK